MRKRRGPGTEPWAMSEVTEKCLMKQVQLEII